MYKKQFNVSECEHVGNLWEILPPVKNNLHWLYCMLFSYYDQSLCVVRELITITMEESAASIIIRQRWTVSSSNTLATNY